MLKSLKNIFSKSGSIESAPAPTAPAEVSVYWRTDDIRIKIDKAAVKHFERYRFAAEKLAELGCSHVLDAACGSGYGSWIIAGKGIYVLGMDIEEEVIVYANRTYKNENTDYRAGDVSDTKLDTSSMDAVVSFETLEHIDAPENALKECRRILKDGGYYIFSIPINHPDTVYHKKIYSLEDAKSLIESFDWQEVSYFYQEQNTPFIVEDIDIVTTIIGICKK